MATDISPTTPTTPAPALPNNNLEAQRLTNEETQLQVQQMQAENIRFQMLMQAQANAFEQRKEAIRQTRSN
jgi:hypothetical protein